MINPPPIQERMIGGSWVIAPVWVIWFQRLTTKINAFTSANDIEVTDSGKGVILKSPDGTRWRVQVDNSGNLTTTSL